MASLPTPPTTGIATSNTSLSPSLHKNSQISTLPKRSNKPCLPRRLSCKANNNNHDINPINDVVASSQTPNPKIDRRNVLLGLGSLGGLAGLRADPFAFAAPIAPPDLSQCGAADFPAGVEPVNCSNCGLQAAYPRQSSLEAAGSCRGQRLHCQVQQAMELMKALPDSDPRSFKQQASVHCAYCDGAYEQVGFPDLDIQVHNSWLFFPFHRWYLYFFERILGKLIDDPNFAMPFWNWDAPAGMQMPAIYADQKSPLYDRFRNKGHLPPKIIDLDFNGQEESISNQAQIQANLTIMYRQVVSNGRNARVFLGEPCRAGDEPDPGPGAFENIPHGPVHVWTGDNTQPYGEDMGNFYSAGRDALFYAHHSNIDRIWNIWKTLGGRRQDLTDPDWLDAAFLFYDENAQLVRVKVRDCLDSRKLGYDYQDVEIPWLNTRPTPPRRVTDRVRRALDRIGAARAAPEEYTKANFPLTLDKPMKTLVSRQKKSRSKKEKDDADEVLVIQGIEFDRNVAIKFDVFINDEDDAPTGPDKSEFAGSFVSVPHRHKSKTKMNTCLKLDITELLEDLDAEGDENVVVTLVPKVGTGHVSIGGLKIELVS